MRIFVLALALLASTSLHADEPDIKGSTDSPIWYGEMDVGPRLFRFVIESFESGDGKPSHRLISLDEGRQKFALSEFKLTNSSLSFALTQTKADYAGKRSSDGQAVTGKWKQNNLEFALNFKRMPEPPKDDPKEVWSGELKTLFQKLAIQFRVYSNDDGTETVFLDSITQKAGGFKAIRTVENNVWTFEIPILNATFKGELNDEKTKIEGTYTQSGIPLKLTLSREASVSDSVAQPPNRPQNPKPPFPYDVEEVQFESKAEGVRLAGTLTIPKGQNAAAAVVMITGSGLQDRDETIVDHKPFWVIADHLSRHGIAVLRCDDRGAGQSTGDGAAATSEDFSHDVEAAVDFLQNHARVDRNRVGLIGHSEGGLIAPMVAARRPDVAFIVLLAGTGVNGEKILLSQGQLILKATGETDEEQLKSQAAIQKALFQTARSAQESDTTDQLTEKALTILRAEVSDASAIDDTMQSSLRAGIERVRTPWFRYFMDHEPGPVLRKVKCPVLALNGSKDVQVDPKLNLTAIAAELKAGGNMRFEAAELPGLNHLFQTATTGAVSEYAEIEETFAPSALQRMTDWIAKVVQ